MTIANNLYNGWMLVNLPNLNHRCDQNSEDYVVTCKRDTLNLGEMTAAAILPRNLNYA